MEKHKDLFVISNFNLQHTDKRNQIYKQNGILFNLNLWELKLRISKDFMLSILPQ